MRIIIFQVCSCRLSFR